MKNSIKAIFAMLAILPCALFFTACGGEKITTEAAQEAFAAAVEQTGEVTSDFQMKINLKFGSKLTPTPTNIEVGTTVKKSGEATIKDDEVNIDKVKAEIVFDKVDIGTGDAIADGTKLQVGKIGDKILLLNHMKEGKAYMTLPAVYQPFWQ